MSADSWAQCPRCTRRGEAELEKLQQAVNDSYGKVVVERFDAARAAVAEERAKFDAREPTFREDYEFYGAETGVVTAEYKGCCTKCGLTLKFEDVHVIKEEE